MFAVSSIAAVAAAYLVGALPFGYFIGRMRGVNLFHVGSGNIGATNAARVLGRPIGLLVFVLDFLKGALPVALAVPIAESLEVGASTAFGTPELLRVLAAAMAILGHMFPIYLGFRGGKGVATGAGTVFILVPVPAIFALLAWLITLISTRTVSLASLTALAILIFVWLSITPASLSENNLPVTTYLLVGSIIVILKHRANIQRLLSGTEPRIGDVVMAVTLVRCLHVLALGLWFGGAAFFNFGTAVPIFASFKEVVHGGPSDRTANQVIIAADASESEKNALASALAGAAVGPVFPRYFAMQAVCGIIALLTALGWWRLGGIHRWRVLVIVLGVVLAAVGWPISQEVSRLRLERFHADPAIASAARQAFEQWHFVSLGLSMATVALAGAALALAARLPVPSNSEVSIRTAGVDGL